MSSNVVRVRIVVLTQHWYLSHCQELNRESIPFSRMRKRRKRRERRKRKERSKRRRKFGPEVSGSFHMPE